jgi:hypothetical protein
MRIRLISGLVAAGATVALAWQGGVAIVGITDADAQQIAHSFFGSSSRDSLPGPYFLKGSMAAQWKAKGPAERAQAVREMALYAKRFVSTPAFAAMYTGWIKDRYHAIDHGLKVDEKADAAKAAAAMSSEAGMKQLQSQMAATVAQSFGQMPPATLKMLFDQDVKNWKGDSDKAKLLARANQAAPLFTSNPDEFKKQYILIKSIEMGGPDTMAGIQAANAGVAKAQDEQKARDEQKAFDEHKLNVELKRRLQDFVALARSVDYAAATKPQGGKLAFVNTAYERKSDAWKKLYRLGKEPSLAMAAVAEQWLKEL